MLNLIASTVLSCLSLSAVDGDTIKCDGQNMRLLGNGVPFKSGIDAPETNRAKCAKERLLGEQARLRLEELLRTPGLQIQFSGYRDRTKERRPLVRLALPDGREAGQVLIDDGYAVKWTPRYRRAWCD